VGSGFGFLLQILVNAADLYKIVAGGAGAKDQN
jgi:hypothetical protein